VISLGTVMLLCWLILQHMEAGLTVKGGEGFGPSRWVHRHSTFWSISGLFCFLSSKSLFHWLQNVHLWRLLIKPVLRSDQVCSDEILCSLRCVLMNCGLQCAWLITICWQIEHFLCRMETEVLDLIADDESGVQKQKSTYHWDKVRSTLLSRITMHFWEI